MHSQSWDDLRIALMVAETGSVAAAAKKLGVAHTTILRRISAFEASTGARLFERTSRGYAISDDRAAAFEAIKDAARAVERAWGAIHTAALPPGEMLRLTSTDSLTTTILPRIAAGLRKTYPALEIALLSFNTHLNLAHGQADLTIRPAIALPEDLEGEIVGQMGLAEYTTPGAPDAWVRGSGPLLRSQAVQWMAVQQSGGGVQADSFVVLRELVAAGHGRSILPCILADPDARLVRVTGPEPRFTIPIWLAGHRELADTTRLHRLRRDIARAVKGLQKELLGRL